MDYLKQKQLLLNSILENTQAQTKLIEDDNMEALEELIDERQTMMKQVDELDGQFGNTAGEGTPKQAELIKDILGQIIAIDNANQSFMKNELGNVKSELLKIRIGRQQGENYGPEYGTYREEGIFFDTKE